MSFILPHVLDVFFGLSANVCYPIIFCITLCKLQHIHVEFLAFGKDTSGNGRICWGCNAFLLDCSLPVSWVAWLKDPAEQPLLHKIWCDTPAGVNLLVLYFANLLPCFQMFAEEELWRSCGSARHRSTISCKYFFSASITASRSSTSRDIVGSFCLASWSHPYMRRARSIMSRG